MKPAALFLITLSLLACDKHQEGGPGPDLARDGSKSNRPSPPATSLRETQGRLSERELAKKSPTELKLLWEQSGTTDLSPDDLFTYREEILKRIVETAGLEQALPLVCSLPAGINRHTLVEAVFGFSDQPLSQLMEIRSRLQEEDKESAFLELEFQARTKGKFSLSDLQGVDLKEGRNGKLLAGVVISMMRDLRSSNGFKEEGKKAAVTQAFESIAELYRAGRVSPEYARKAAEELVESPFNCWSILNSGQESAEELFADHRDRIVSRMAGDPLRAIEQLKAGTMTRDRDFGLLFASWLGADSAAPKAWLESNGSGLSREARNSISSAFALEATEDGNLEEAGRWLGEVQSEELKAQVQNAIDSKRAEQIIEQVKDRPQDTMDGLISGDAAAPAGTVLKAYQSWASQDDEGAYKWFSSQTESLKPEDRNEIAKFYAEKALKDGDVARAREWLEVVDRPVSR
jgi:hypothetical protein